jgi:spermidine synthase
LLLGYPLKELRVVELDPLVFHLAEEHLPRNERQALGDPRVSLFFTDARYFVKNLPPASLDAVILRMPDPSTALLNRYHTVEFFQDLRRALRPGGILTHAVQGAVNYAGADLKDYVGLVYRSLRRVFPEVLVVPGERKIFLASPESGRLSLDPGTLASRLGDLPHISSSVPQEMFFVWIDPQQRGVWEEALLDDEGPVNEDTRPISYLRFLTLWDLVSSRRFGESPLRRLQDLPFAPVLSASVLAVFLLLLGPTGTVSERASLVVMGISGFTAMAQEILCLYMYQALRGYLYSRLGLLVALFMAGLALGTRVASRQHPAGGHRLLRALILVQGFAILVCASVVLGCAPHLFGADSARFPEGALELLFGLWMILAGAATGATFSLACGLQILRGGSVGAVAGRVYGWDHLGAALGALLPGVVLVPLFGVAQTGFLLVVLLGAGACILFLNLLAFSKEAGIGCLGPSR